MLSQRGSSWNDPFWPYLGTKAQSLSPGTQEVKTNIITMECASPQQSFFSGVMHWIVSPKKICWSPNPYTCDVTLFGNTIFMEVIKLKCCHTQLVWALNPICLVNLQEEKREIQGGGWRVKIQTQSVWAEVSRQSVFYNIFLSACCVGHCTKYL